MRTDQKIRLNMYLSVRNYGNLNEAVAKNIPKFASSFVNLQNIIAEIQLIGEMQRVNKTGKGEINTYVMAGTYSQIYQQVVFAGKGRENLISSKWRDVGGGFSRFRRGRLYNTASC